MFSKWPKFDDDDFSLLSSRMVRHRALSAVLLALGALLIFLPWEIPVYRWRHLSEIFLLVGGALLIAGMVVFYRSDRIDL